MSLFLNLALRLHSFSYRLASALACRVEGGVHPKHRITDYHKWFLDRIKPEWRVLDAGCGNGLLTIDLLWACKSITGIDINPDRIAEAKKLIDYPATGIHFARGDITSLWLRGRYDCVIMSNVLEHIEDRVECLGRLSLYADTFLIRVPLITRDWITLYKRERGLPYLGDKDHYIEYTLESFQDEVISAGLEVGDIEIRFGELYAVCCMQKKALEK